jgi:hypothetical protein
VYCSRNGFSKIWGRAFAGQKTIAGAVSSLPCDYWITTVCGPRLVSDNPAKSKGSCRIVYSAYQIGSCLEGPGKEHCSD